MTEIWRKRRERERDICAHMCAYSSQVSERHGRHQFCGIPAGKITQVKRDKNFI